MPADAHYEAREEWFVSGSGPSQPAVTVELVRLRKAAKELLLAMDPRIPDAHEYFEVSLNDSRDVGDLLEVQWFFNDSLVGTTTERSNHRKLSKGAFSDYAEIKLREGDRTVRTETVG